MKKILKVLCKLLLGNKKENKMEFRKSTKSDITKIMDIVKEKNLELDFIMIISIL